MEATVKHNYDDLRSLYRAAAREEQPTRADRRAVRAAMLGAGAGVAAVTLHTSTAAGKLIALIPGGAKVLTIGQVVAYAGLGVAVGGGLAAVGVAVSPKTTPAKTSTMPSTSARKSLTKSNVQSAKLSPSAESAPDLQQPTQFEPIADQEPAPNGAANGDRTLPTPSGATVAERPMPSQPITTPVPPTPGLATVAPSAAPAAVAAIQPPSLAEESRGLAAVQTALGAHDANRAL